MKRNQNFPSLAAGGWWGLAVQKIAADMNHSLSTFKKIEKSRLGMKIHGRRRESLYRTTVHCKNGQKKDYSVNKNGRINKPGRNYLKKNGGSSSNIPKKDKRYVNKPPPKKDKQYVNKPPPKKK
ncbi:hypothetical protein M0812_02144 [Anaeramoeba flamelloides]|uniref:Uncharacterized protein n=1 Tax=Anaeramoeba flamelloides TaxID=1746091 RepID=A0AAV7YZQ7_9EUKA|nr:hypothetical protein M0812_02144 [Anaeramoeba flamelloides]